MAQNEDIQSPNYISFLLPSRIWRHTKRTKCTRFINTIWQLWHCVLWNKSILNPENSNFETLGQVIMAQHTQYKGCITRKFSIGWLKLILESVQIVKMITIVSSFWPNKQIMIVQHLFKAQYFVHIVISPREKMVNLKGFFDLKLLTQNMFSTSSEAISSLLGIIQAKISSLFRLLSPFLSSSESNLSILLQHWFSWFPLLPVLLTYQPLLVLVMAPVTNIFLKAELAIVVCIFFFQHLRFIIW